jgi:hypothetical protein
VLGLIKLKTLGNSSSYALKAVSNADATLSCTVLVSLVDPSFTADAGASLGADAFTTFIEGDVAIGGTPATLGLVGPLGGGGGEKLYVATVRFDDPPGADIDSVARYSIAALAAGNLTPEYDTSMIAGFQAGFLSTGDPRLAADGAGNGYWFQSNGTLRRIRADQLGGVPDTAVLSSIPGLADAQDLRIAADRFGRLYWVGTFGAQFGLLRVSGIFAGPASTTVEVAIPNIPLEFQQQAPLYAIDQYGRVTVIARDAGTFLRWTGETVPFQADPTFDPVLFDASVGPAADLTRAIDLDVDGFGTIYVTIDTTPASGAPTSAIYRFNEDGHVVDVRAGIPSAGGPNPLPAFDRILGLASSAFGTLAVINQPGGVGTTATIYIAVPDDPTTLTPGSGSGQSGVQIGIQSSRPDAGGEQRR